MNHVPPLLSVPCCGVGYFATVRPDHLMDDHGLARRFPCLTKSETDVCRLILAGKKRSEISLRLDKTENNVDVTRNHIRKKLNVPSNHDLKEFLEERALDI